MNRYYPLIKKAVNFLPGMIGLELVRKSPKSRPSLRTSLHDRMTLLRRLGFSPRVIFDCGAYVGNWTRQTSQIFPNAQFLLIEPNPLILEQTRQTIQSIQPEPVLLDCAVSAKTGQATLNIHVNEKSGMAGSSLLEHVQGIVPNRIDVEVKTLDSIADEHNLYPDLLKLDLQGSELTALQGAGEILTTTEVCIIEFGCLDAYINRTTPRDLLDFMYDHEYVLYDIVAPYYRPYDDALAGGDFFFVKASSQLRAYRGFW